MSGRYVVVVKFEWPSRFRVQAEDTRTTSNNTHEPTLYGLAFDLCSSLQDVGKALQCALIETLKVRYATWYPPESIPASIFSFHKFVNFAAHRDA
jgi:hypothetical protein